MNLDGIAALDHHAHNLLKPEAVARYPYAAAFTEGTDWQFAQRTLCYRRSLRDIAALLNCEATEAAILAERDRRGFDALTALCFRTANLESIYLDDGFLPEQVLPLEWHSKHVPVKPLLRVEVLAQDLLPRSGDFGDFLAQYRAALDPPPANVVGFKSIAAYRTGLAVQSVDRTIAETHFEQARREA